MSIQTSASPRRLAVGAVLLILAATASGCGVGLPTQPDLDSGAALERGAAITQSDVDGPLEFGDDMPPTGGADQTNKPPAGEEVIPTPTTFGGNGNHWGWVHKKPKN